MLVGCSSKDRIEEIVGSDVPEFAKVQLHEKAKDDDEGAPVQPAAQPAVPSDEPVVRTASLEEPAEQQTKEIIRALKGSGGHYKVGKPYKIDGVWYFPREDWAYDEVGNASWYGEDWHGKRTANGEIFDMDNISAAHRTLPLPSLARVTNLANGMSTIVRVNDRGPFANDRILDLSRAAAQLLRLSKYGSATVRVQILSKESRMLKEELLAKRRKNRVPVKTRAAEEEEAVDNKHRAQVRSFFSKLLEPNVDQKEEKSAAPEAKGDKVVQVATFNDLDDAQRLAFKIRSELHREAVVKGSKRRMQSVFNVRITSLTNRDAHSVIRALKRSYKIRDAYVILP